MKNIFKTKTNYYNTLNELIFPKEMLKQLNMDYRPCLTWVLRVQPKEMKQVTNLNEFKATINFGILKFETVLTDSPELIFHR